jgi:hypothetical protein
MQHTHSLHDFQSLCPFSVFPSLAHLHAN